MKKARILWLAAAIGAAGCAPRPMKSTAFDFSKVRKIAVQPFEGDGGEAATKEFIRQLLGTGLEVVERTKGADAIVGGAVTQYRAANKRMIFLGTSTAVSAAGQSATVNNPVLASGAPVTAEGTTYTLPSSQMVAANAVTAETIRLTEPSSGKVLWSQQFSYEGVDLEIALRSVTSVLIRSLQLTLGSGASAKEGHG